LLATDEALVLAAVRTDKGGSSAISAEESLSARDLTDSFHVCIEARPRQWPTHGPRPTKHLCM
jgi:hypothetical protein